MFGKRLKELRIEEGILQKELADKLSLTQQTISLYESGSREPGSKTMSKIADYFNVSLDYLLSRTNIKNPYEIQTIAAHNDGDEWTEEELESIEEYKEFVRMRRQNKGMNQNEQ